MKLNLFLLISQAIAQECISGPVDFIRDMTVDYNVGNVIRTSNSAQINLIKTEGGPATGSRLSTIQQYLYGKFTINMSALPVNGVIVTFITMSDRGDEIDFEVVGGDKTAAQSNVFYKGIPDYGKRVAYHQIGDVIGPRTYTIDWTPTYIKWSVDGRLVRTYSINDRLAVEGMTPRGEKSFPVTPSRIQIGIWDAGSGPEGTSIWAGGPIPWGSATQMQASFGNLVVECYKGPGVKSFAVENPLLPEAVRNSTFPDQSMLMGTSIQSKMMESKHSDFDFSVSQSLNSHSVTSKSSLLLSVIGYAALAWVL
ncbi:concanavalin A-like lectin/glucanase domain-containing protein [Globomyces pollinis-pini]|nr:concanavalin A-like lectin/glucanase domain-containing protein [Globomyces pollinis-pini]